MVNIAPYTTTYETQGFCCYRLPVLATLPKDEMIAIFHRWTYKWNIRWCLYTKRGRSCALTTKVPSSYVWVWVWAHIERRALLFNVELLEKVQYELSFFWNRSCEQMRKKQREVRRKCRKLLLTRYRPGRYNEAEAHTRVHMHYALRVWYESNTRVPVIWKV